MVISVNHFQRVPLSVCHQLAAALHVELTVIGWIGRDLLAVVVADYQPQLRIGAACEANVYAVSTGWSDGMATHAIAADGAANRFVIEARR